MAAMTPRDAIEGELPLSARARSGLAHAAALARTLEPANRVVAAALRAAGLDDEALADDLDERARQVEPVAETVPAFQAARHARDWYGEHHGRLAIAAFEELADQLVPLLDAAREGPTTLDPNPAQPLPRWWTEHWIHRTHGGWDGHPYQGFIQGCIVHRELVARIMAPADIFAQRRQVAQRVAALGGRRILEMGAGYGPFTLALTEALPEAEVWACEMSLRQVEQAQRLLNVHGATVRLKRCDAADTGLPAGSFDVVTSYAMLHEIPVATTEAVFREALRLLAPGGRLLFVDVPPFERLGKLAQWQVDHAARHEGEPFWRESALLDVAGLLRRIGFEQVTRSSPNTGPYPFPFLTEAVAPR
ncbi:MAG: class I SAM-dependent methyltransferase [Steroidobacteraceae bacterium]|jgi:SAM-dependent methyltransferase|nr:class I SAM-dependent methyltransferase [Steroidobacteraceae bacterium]